MFDFASPLPRAHLGLRSAGDTGTIFLTAPEGCGHGGTIVGYGRQAFLKIFPGLAVEIFSGT